MVSLTKRRVYTMKELHVLNQPEEQAFEQYELKFKALADKKRLQIMHELCKRGEICVCDMCEIIGMQQSKLSYHLKILLDTNLIKKETRGTWSYYKLNSNELENILSEKLCCIFRPDSTSDSCC
jgi:ArsR family transcriptional regulator